LRIERKSTCGQLARDGATRLALTWYEFRFILQDMRVGERGQVTIPKDIRDQFGLGPETEVEFHVVGGSIVLKKAPKKLNLAKWKGRCGDTFARLGYSSVDKFIDDVRGR
jgi:AbrB family looped-hinge helix DNA binding protein